jgi:hypothetical protein
MDRYKYMRLVINTLLDKIIQQHKLLDLVHDGYVYVKICRGMYGLPPAGIIIANQLLVKRLAPFGYYPVTHNPGLWRHKHHPILFPLVVDDFGVKYVGKEHADHLIDTLKSLPWTGKPPSIVAIPWIGIMTTAPLTSPCPTTWRMHSTTFKIAPPNTACMPPPNGQPHSMAPRSN